MRQAKKFTLGKAERLKRRKQIEAVFARGKSFTAFPLKVVYLLEESASDEFSDAPAGLQMGVSVSKRHWKRAVDRNRIKRLMREGFRIHKLPLQDALLQKDLQAQVFFIFLDNTLPTFDLVESKIKYALRRMLKMVEEFS